MKKIIFLTLFSLLFGCSTNYQTSGFSGGFSEIRTAQNQYRITFNGNGFTSVERVLDFSLLRAAELTIQNGYNHFLVINSGTTFTRGNTPIPVPNTVGFGRSFAESYNATAGLKKPSSTIEIYFLEKDELELYLGKQVYDASILSSEIKNKYEIK